MPNLFKELQALLDSMAENKIDYALCGGLAMAIHGLPRATIDIDVLILPQSLTRAKKAAAKLGFVLPALPMSFNSGKIHIERVSKIDPESNEVLTLDMLLVTPETTDVWSSRKLAEWEYGQLWVVSREGLIKLKQMRMSGIDQDDIKRLRSEES